MAPRDALQDRIRVLIGEGVSWEDASGQAQRELGCADEDDPPIPRLDQAPPRPHRTRRRRWTARAAARVVCQAALTESVPLGECGPVDGARVVRQALSDDDCARRVLVEEEPTEELERLIDALRDARDAAAVILILLEILLAILELVVGKIPARIIRALRELVVRLRRLFGG